MRATLKAVKRQLVRRRHDPVPVQGRWLAQMLRGYFAYYAVPTNWCTHPSLPYRNNYLPLAPAATATQPTHGAELAADEPALAPLASAGPVHTLAGQAFLRQDPRWEPGAVVPHAGFCAGGGPTP